MKNTLSITLIAFIVFGLSACTKKAPNQGGSNPFASNTTVNPNNTGDNGGSTEPTPKDLIGEVPADFTKKVLIEKLTGEWCGLCPKGGTDIDAIAAANPNQVYAASWQMGNGDPFELPAAQTWRAHLSNGSGVTSFKFPSASLNRAPSISLPDYLNTALDVSDVNWIAQTNSELAKAAECGMALVTSEKDNKVNVDVYVGYNNAISSNTYLTVYLIEDNVPESASGAQISGGGNYLHKHMIRDVLTADLGNPISLSTLSVEKHVKVELNNLDISGKYNNKNNLKILAFINVQAPTADKLSILNVQQVRLGENKKFD